MEQTLEQAQNMEYGIMGAAGSIGAAVTISRILGLVRDQVQAKYFGAGLYTDAWNIAFRIPNLLRDLFAEGALSSAFIPTFASWLNFGLLLSRFRRKTAASWSIRELNAYIRIALASVLMGLLSLLVFHGVRAVCPGPGVLAQAFRLAVAILAAMAALFPLFRLLEVEEANDLTRLIVTLIGRIR